MSNKGTETALKQEINLNIIPNNQQQLITGAKLNVVLLDMVDTLMYLLGNGSGGAANYENLYNKPSINGYELNGEVSLSALGLISSADIALAYQKKITESNKLAADYISGLAKVAITGDYNDLINKPEISGGEVSNVSWGEQTATSVALIVEGVGKTLLTPQALDNYVQASTLFENGVIRSTLLPSYVDDVLEYTSRSNFPSTGQAGKIYVALDTNKTYRWGGSTYVVISETIAIGTTAGTAYDGAAGKALADAVAGIPNHYYNKTEIDDILLGYVDDAQIASYYNKNEVDNKLKGYVTNAAFADSIDDYLTITDAEETYYKKTGGIISGGVTINGATTINNSLSVNSLKIGGISISVNSDGILFVEGTLATSGGLSVRGVSTGSGGGGSASLPAVWESLSGDRDEYKNVQINKSHLTAYLTATEVATSYATRGSLAALDERVTEIESSSTSVSYTPSVTSGQLLGTIVIDGKGSAIYAPSIAGLASESWVSNNYLPLSGGTITGMIYAYGGVEVKDATYPAVQFRMANDGNVGWLWYNGGNRWGVTNHGWTEQYNLIHSGNIGSYAPIYNSAGNVTIGNGDFAGTDAKLAVVGKHRIYRADDNRSYLDITVGDVSVAYNGYDTDGWASHYFQSNGNTLMTINGYSGNVGIGTTDPRYKLDVNGPIAGHEIYSFAGWMTLLGTENVSYSTYLDNKNQYGLKIHYSNGVAGAFFSQDGNTEFYGNIAIYAAYGEEKGFSVSNSKGWVSMAVAGGGGSYISTSSQLAIYTNNSQRMLINSAGNVGIGTNSPERALDVVGDIGATGTAVANNFYGRVDEADRVSPTEQLLVLQSAGSNSVARCPGIGFHLSGHAYSTIKMLSNGSFGFYNDQLTGYVDVYCNNLTAVNVKAYTFKTNGDYGIWQGSQFTSSLSANDIAIYGGQIGIWGDVIAQNNITASGTIAGRSLSVTSVNQSSDKKLKREESRSTPLTIEDVAQLNVRSYKWIDESMGKELQIGLYAQDVQTIIPEIVRENEQSKSLGLDYGVGGAVFGVLAAQSIVKQIKPALTEQQKRIVELEQRVEFLEKLTYGGK